MRTTPIFFEAGAEVVGVVDVDPFADEAVAVGPQPDSKVAPVAAMRENKTTFKWFFMPLILFSHLLPMKMENDLFKDKKTLKFFWFDS
jgi:hypothetical protein